MEIDVILFDWGGTLSQVGSQAERLRRGVALAAQIITGGRSEADVPLGMGVEERHRTGVGDSDVPHSVESLIDRILSIEAEAAAHPEHLEADPVAELRAWASSLAAEIEPQRLTEAAACIGQTWIGSLEPLPGALEALRTLRQRGYQMGLVSNCMIPAVYCRQEFARMGFAEWVDFTVFSSEVGYRKPSPVIYQAALRLAFSGEPPADLSRVLFVGDSPALDIMGPARLGMKTALVTCRRGIWHQSDYESARPDFRIDSVAELPELLKR